MAAALSPRLSPPGSAHLHRRGLGRPCHSGTGRGSESLAPRPHPSPSLHRDWARLDCRVLHLRRDLACLCDSDGHPHCDSESGWAHPALPEGRAGRVGPHATGVRAPMIPPVDPRRTARSAVRPGAPESAAASRGGQRAGGPPKCGRNGQQGAAAAGAAAPSLFSIQ